ncbi:MAG: hypothetical protein ACYTGZ_19125 [Planctomycetota bacterium]|jgi:hypothetical protein
MDTESLVFEAVGLSNYTPEPDADSFNAYLANLKRVTDRVTGLGDGMHGQPWFRLHAVLVHSGIWANLKPCSRSVLVTLAALADRRTRVTFTGVEKVAKLSGLSVPRTLFAYRELKDYGLIWRRRGRLGRYQPYFTGLLNPGRWKPTGPETDEVVAPVLDDAEAKLLAALGLD